MGRPERAARFLVWMGPSPENAKGNRQMVDIAKVALLVRLEARPGKEAEVAQLLRHAQPIVEGEPATTTWFAFQFGPTSFGLFDTFPDDSVRQAHLSGPVAEMLSSRGEELFVAPPSIEQLDVLAAKLP